MQTTNLVLFMGQNNRWGLIHSIFCLAIPIGSIELVALYLHEWLIYKSHGSCEIFGLSYNPTRPLVVSLRCEKNCDRTSQEDYEDVKFRSFCRFHGASHSSTCSNVLRRWFWIWQQHQVVRPRPSSGNPRGFLRCNKRIWGSCLLNSSSPEIRFSIILSMCFLLKMVNFTDSYPSLKLT